MWLFNLATDPTEQVNLAAQDPARVAELRKLIEAQNAGLPKPLWPGLLEAPIRIDVPLNAAWKKDQEYVYWANCSRRDARARRRGWLRHPLNQPVQQKHRRTSEGWCPWRASG